MDSVPFSRLTNDLEVVIQTSAFFHIHLEGGIDSLLNGNIEL